MIHDKDSETSSPRSSCEEGEARLPYVTAAELLLEIGVEELPYQFIAPALAAPQRFG